jgi:sugar phosphate isomerase/epimerase
MKLALQTYSLHLAFGRHPDCQHYPIKLTLEDCFKKAKKWGFSGVQIDPTHINDYTENNAKYLRNLADSEGLFLEMGVEGFERNHLGKQLQFAQLLGARFVRIFEVVGPRPNDTAQIERRLDFIHAEIEHVLLDLEKMNIVLGWENHADYSTTEQLAVLKQIDHPNFRTCIDIGNSMMFLEPPLETVKKLIPFAGGVHLKDYAVKGTTFGLKFYGTALGKGIIPLKEILSILKQKTDLLHLVYEQSIEPISNDYREAISHEEKTLVQSLRFAHDELGLEIV